LFAKFCAPQLCLMIISGCRMMVISWVLLQEYLIIS
jgi:hypothetical protein